MENTIAIPHPYPLYREDLYPTEEQYQSEEQLQAACFQWFWNEYPSHRQMLFHVQQKARNRIEGSRFKAMGVVQGVSDLMLVILGRVIFIEMKITKGDQSTEQVSFEYKLRDRGHVYLIRRSLQGFQETVKYLLAL